MRREPRRTIQRWKSSSPGPRQSFRPTPIKEMAQAAREAGKENAARTAPAKKKEARDDR